MQFGNFLRACNNDEVWGDKIIIIINIIINFSALLMTSLVVPESVK